MFFCWSKTKQKFLQFFLWSHGGSSRLLKFNFCLVEHRGRFLSETLSIYVCFWNIYIYMCICLFIYLFMYMYIFVLQHQSAYWSGSEERVLQIILHSKNILMENSISLSECSIITKEYGLGFSLQFKSHLSHELTRGLQTSHYLYSLEPHLHPAI